MAFPSPSPLICSFIVMALAFFVLLISPAAAAVYGAGGRKVGGRTEVKDVESNQEVQELGLFAVHEYNRRMSSPTDNSEDGGDQHRLLAFSHVVAAERQVVSGLMYYLRILAVHAEEYSAGGEAAEPRTFEAVVLTKPWLGARELVSFAQDGAAGGKNIGIPKGF